MIPQSAFFKEAHQLCGSKQCTIRNAVKSQQQSYNDALGIGVNVTADDEVFEGEYIASIMPTTITKSTKQGKLELVKGWQAVVKIPEDKKIDSGSRIILQDGDEEHIILKWVKSLSQNLYTLVIT